MEVVYLKMTNGEDVLASLVEESDTQITITNPVCINKTELGYKVRLGMYPWVPMIELMNLNYKFSKMNISAMTSVPEDMVKDYNTMLSRMNDMHQANDADADADMAETDEANELNEEEIEQITNLATLAFSNNKTTLH